MIGIGSPIDGSSLKTEDQCLKDVPLTRSEILCLSYENLRQYLRIPLKESVNGIKKITSLFYTRIFYVGCNLLY